MTFVAISEVVNLVHERDLFLALGNDVMDDVHLFAVVDTGVRNKRLKDRKRCTHNFSWPAPRVSIPVKRTIHF